jgi:hypothetical protein
LAAPPQCQCATESIPESGDSSAIEYEEYFTDFPALEFAQLCDRYGLITFLVLVEDTNVGAVFGKAEYPVSAFLRRIVFQALNVGVPGTEVVVRACELQILGQQWLQSVNVTAAKASQELQNDFAIGHLTITPLCQWQ